MSGKQSKKIRQMFRRTVKDRAEEMGKMIGNAMKPKPKYIPWRIWLWLVKLVIKTK